jgi:hypothetical protein
MFIEAAPEKMEGGDPWILVDDRACLFHIVRSSPLVRIFTVHGAKLVVASA